MNSSEDFRKPMTHDDPKTPVAKVVRSHFGYRLRCQQCGEEGIFYKDKRVRQRSGQARNLIFRGHQMLFFCSIECKRKFQL